MTAQIVAGNFGRDNGGKLPHENQEEYRHLTMGRMEAAGRSIRRVAVLGAGTMGAQIAALVADQGVDCDLFDLDSELAEGAKQRLLELRPRPLSDVSSLDRIRAGSFDCDLDRLWEADWVIEAVIERLEPKLELWRRCSPHVRQSTVLSTNTSGIPIEQLSKALPAEMRRRFLGTHFFNPPRYLHLLELIPTPETDQGALSTIRTFAEDALGKGVVTAHDVPGFITNRIGCFYFLAAIEAAEEFGFSPDEVDAISGPLMGRSSSATFRTIDLVGVDILLDICDNTRDALSSTAEREAFTAPQLLREMRERNWLGNKTGQGFYKREKVAGHSRTLALDTKTLCYGDRRRDIQDSLVVFQDLKDAGERLRALIASEGPAGQFAWRVLSELLVFSASKVGEVADDIVSMDRAMRWGFNWELGPFETWGALGVADSTNRMESDGLIIPDWIVDVARSGGSFYRREGEVLMQATPAGTYEQVTD